MMSRLDLVNRVYEAHPGLRALRPFGWRTDEKVAVVILDPKSINVRHVLVINDRKLRDELRPYIRLIHANVVAMYPHFVIGVGLLGDRDDSVLCLSAVQ